MWYNKRKSAHVQIPFCVIHTTPMPTLDTPSPTKSPFKYEAWADGFRARIHRGELVPGDKLPSHGAMKEQFGLSRPTVERIHSLLESEGLIVREERRGAFVAEPPDVSARTVGVFSPLSERYEHQPYNMHLLSGIRHVVERDERQIMLLGDSALDAGRKLDWSQLGGVLTVAAHEQHLTSLLDTMPPGMPCVTLIGESPRALSITCDDYHGSMTATEYLLELGHRRIAALISPITLVTRRRIEGYRQALQETGIFPDAKWLRDQDYHLTAKHGFTQAAQLTMQQWLAEGWSTLDATAIVAQNDESAIGIIEALQEAGLRVPQDVSVIGFDGTETARNFRPQLTTMAVPLFEIGARGAQRLIEEMEKATKGVWNSTATMQETITISPQLQIGATTASAKSI